MDEPGANASIRVALVDDQVLFRAGLEMMVESQPDMVLCGSAGNGQEAVAMASSSEPDVMLMDLRMPVMDGVEATKRIVSSARAGGCR
jgi:DNA-binding NarL/FixJ family response regulator